LAALRNPRRVLLDTFVWIEHFKGSTDSVERLFADESVTIVLHPLIIAELTLGGISQSDPEYHWLDQQEKLTEVSSAAILELIATEGLSGKGVGYVDCGLVASCIADDASLVTLDKKLAEVAKGVGILFDMSVL
jgi:predicted nucleic acid-binding protein